MGFNKGDRVIHKGSKRTGVISGFYPQYDKSYKFTFNSKIGDISVFLNYSDMDLYKKYYREQRLKKLLNK